jgi:hypothetical protein
MALTFTDVYEFHEFTYTEDFSLSELDQLWWFLEHIKMRHDVEPDPNITDRLKAIFSQISNLSLSSDDLMHCQNSVDDLWHSHPDFVPLDDEEEFLAFQQSMKAFLQKLPSNNQKTPKKKSSKKNFWDL